MIDTGAAVAAVVRSAGCATRRRTLGRGSSSAADGELDDRIRKWHGESIDRHDGPAFVPEPEREVVAPTRTPLPAPHDPGIGSDEPEFIVGASGMSEHEGGRADDDRATAAVIGRSWPMHLGFDPELELLDHPSPALLEQQAIGFDALGEQLHTLAKFVAHDEGVHEPHRQHGNRTVRRA